MGLKERLLGRKKREIDYEAVRSHVLSERPFAPAPAPENIREKYGFGPGPEIAETFPGSEPFQKRPEPALAFREEDFGAAGQRSGSYEILDRLQLIESQLAAIRSQTETINERLKNLEARLSGRRY